MIGPTKNSSGTSRNATSWTSTDEEAVARHEYKRRKARNAPPAPLPTFISGTRDLDEPRHLQPLTDLFSRIPEGESVKALVTTPPQHGKSQTCLHALVWLLKQRPHLRHAYATYAQQFSRDQSYLATRIAEQHALRLDKDTQDRWITSAGGGVAWTSRGGPLTGRAVDGVLIIDDLLKDREEANSPLIRDKAMGWLSSVAMTRMHPGASIVLVATRWHLDDPTGRLLERGGWEYIKLPAIKPDGTALWPERRPLAWLEQQKQNLLPSDWNALYLCEPIADGQRVFSAPTLYGILPDATYREAHGFDAAYSEKTVSDYSVTLTGRLINNKIYLTNMIRAQLQPARYIALLKAHGVQRVTWFRSGTEIGLEELLQREGVRVDALTARSDKLARAIPAATAWNRGDILTPANAPWRADLEKEITQFTGVGDAHDDIIDALAALHYALVGTPEPRIRSV